MKFNKDSFYCLDGGFGSQLSNHFGDTVDSHPLWACRALKEDREAVIKTHMDYIEAGSQIITTDSYQVSTDLLRKHISFKDPVRGPQLLIEESVELAEEAIVRATGKARSILIAGSIGPYGACLGDGSEYDGSYIGKVTRKEMTAWHLERMLCLSSRKVDLFAVETIPSVEEALAVLDAVEMIPDVRCWISFSCKDGRHNCKGERLDQVFRKLAMHPAFRSRVVAVGVNCNDSKDISSQLELFNKVNNPNAWPEVDNYQKIPYVVYPNAGSIHDWDTENKCWLKEGDLDYIVSHVREWMCLGANIIGGCCRVDSEAISKICQVISKYADEVKALRK